MATECSRWTISKDLQIVPAQFEEDGFLSRLGIFATGNVTFGDKNSTGEIGGFDFDTEGLTIGADYRLTDNLVLGAAAGYSHFNADFDESDNSPGGQELDSDAAQFSLFGSFYPDRPAVRRRDRERRLALLRFGAAGPRTV